MLDDELGKPPNVKLMRRWSSRPMVLWASFPIVCKRTPWNPKRWLTSLVNHRNGKSHYGVWVSAASKKAPLFTANCTVGKWMENLFAERKKKLFVFPFFCGFFTFSQGGFIFPIGKRHVLCTYFLQCDVYLLCRQPKLALEDHQRKSFRRVKCFSVSRAPPATAMEL